MSFYLLFAAVYGFMHWVCWFQACQAFHPPGALRLALAGALAVLALLPFVLLFNGERTGVLSFVTFFWMGLVFYLAMGSLLLFAASPWLGEAVRRGAFLCVILGSFAVCVYGVQNARDIRVVELTVPVTNLPAGVDRVRLAVVSDLHLYSVEEGRRLDRVLPVLAGLDYDVLLSLGDMIESGTHRGDWKVSAARLAALRPHLGKFAVDGNHEVYAARLARDDISGRFLETAGFRRLRDEVVDVGGLFSLAGIDYGGNVFAPDAGRAGDAAILERAPADKPVVVIKHLPTVDPAAIGRFDLQLSGHTHAGQIWPFEYLVRRLFPYVQGLYDLGRGSKLYVNVGTGTWGPPMRVGSHAEITLVTLERAPEVQAK